MSATSACLDTSALIALMDESDPWHEAVLSEFQKYKSSGMVFITEVVFAEASAGMSDAEELRTVIDTFGIDNLAATDEALFLAGQVYKDYRQSRGDGKKDGVLPDFMIGALAKQNELALITFNDRDFVKKFPGLEVRNPLA